MPDEHSSSRAAPGVSSRSSAKTHRMIGRPAFECIALLLQGGGALGSYQAGVYEALAEADIHPDWVAGISIGAVNAALIVGNPPERRVARLREFWEAVSKLPFGLFGVPDARRSTSRTYRRIGLSIRPAPSSSPCSACLPSSCLVSLPRWNFCHPSNPTNSASMTSPR